MRWSSSARGVIRVNGELLTALAPGQATLTAKAGAARATVAVRVVPGAGRVVLAPATADVRPGDVVPFAATYRDASGGPWKE